MALLTADTVGSYAVEQLQTLGEENPLPEGAEVTAKEIMGGNLNYAFCVEAKTGQSFFVKQAPDFVKVLGEDAKLSRDRMILEMAFYREWDQLLGKEQAAKFFPKIYAVDTNAMSVIMEFLGSYKLLQEELYSGVADQAVAATMGEVMGLMHSKTHCTKISAAEAGRLTEAYENPALRGIQMEHVFTKAFRDSERAEGLRKDEAFQAELEKIRASYRGENKGDLALCHGDLHPGSAMADIKAAAVKVIDPEFAIYGPPGVDVGSLLSGYILAFISLVMSGSGSAPSMMDAISTVWASYAKTLEANGIEAGVIAGIGEDTVGFAACEVARTALGCAGHRNLPIADLALKSRAEERALALAHRCIMGRQGKGFAVLDEELHKFGEAERSQRSQCSCAVS